MWPAKQANATDEWHVLVVAEHRYPEDPQATLYHLASCDVGISSRSGIHHECATQWQLDQNGYFGMFDCGPGEVDPLRPGVWLIAPWAEKIWGADWVEHDGGWYVHAVTS